MKARGSLSSLAVRVRKARGASRAADPFRPLFTKADAIVGDTPDQVRQARFAPPSDTVMPGCQRLQDGLRVIVTGDEGRAPARGREKSPIIRAALFNDDHEQVAAGFIEVTALRN